MSFFFDVWTKEGFILTSDVRMIINGKVTMLHKLASSRNSKIVCAIAVCGDYPENCLNFFLEATMTKDTMRDAAFAFSQKWTDRYAGTKDYSGVHLVGFEKVHSFVTMLPQMWYWCNWKGPNPDDFFSNEELSLDIKSFSKPIPHNNHIPYKIKELTGKFPGPTLGDETKYVIDFLQKYQPFFTWNGDTSFWRSALGTIDSAMALLLKEKTK